MYAHGNQSILQLINQPNHPNQVWHLDSRNWHMSVASTAQSSEIAAKLDKNDKKRRNKKVVEAESSSSGGSGTSSSSSKEKSSSNETKGKPNKGTKNKAGSGSADDSLVEVEVVVMGARKLPKADVFGSSDPYAVGTWQRTKVSDGLTFVWVSKIQTLYLRSSQSSGFGYWQGKG